MLERKELVEKEVLRSTVDSETRAAQGSKVRSVVHHVAGQTQRQSGSPSVPAAAVATDAAANACGLDKM